MRKSILAWLLTSLLLLIAGCGGGGGGGTSGPTNITLTGLVETINNFGAPATPATIQQGTLTTVTAVDGSFSLSVPSGTNSILVIYTPPGGTALTFRFDFDAATADRDLGTLVVGPEKITAAGRVLNQLDSAPISGARVLFGGISGLTGADGRFTITDVAYDSTRPGNFFGVEGRAGKTGFFIRLFNAANGPASGTANLGDITLLPDSGNAAPGTPYNIEGTVGPAGDAPGTIITLLSGSTPIRQFTVGVDRRFGFWVAPGTYTIRGTKPGSSLIVPDTSVVLTSPVSTVRQDVSLQ
jgi:hypothetical protein